MPDYRTCVNCMHFKPDVNECRRFPPQLHTVDTATLTPVPGVFWPVVDPEEDWCGEFDNGIRDGD